jgi:type IV secretory pathway VirB2 component (pilin)
MKRYIQTIFVAFAMMLGLTSALASAAGAINVFKGCDGKDATSEVCKNSSESVQQPVQNIISTLLVAVGIIAVIMIIVGGLRYILSNGDASKIKSAKDTVLYSVVGLVVAMLAYAIVNFAVAQF